jgi:hypothetical protein
LRIVARLAMEAILPLLGKNFGRVSALSDKRECRWGMGGLPCARG